MVDDPFRADWETVVNDMATASNGETCNAEYPASGRDTLKGCLWSHCLDQTVPILIHSTPASSRHSQYGSDQIRMAVDCRSHA